MVLCNISNYRHGRTFQMTRIFNCPTLFMFDSKLPFNFKVCSLLVKLNGVFVSYNIQIYHPPFSQHEVSNPSQTAIPYNLPLYASIQIFQFSTNSTYVVLYFNNSLLSDNNSQSLLKSDIMYFISYQVSYFQHTVFKFITNSSMLYVSHYKNLNTTWFLQWWPQLKADSQQAASYTGSLLDFITTYLCLKCFIDTFKLAMYSSKPHSGKDYLYNQHSLLNTE
jgi:hypothetical protein